MTCPDCDGPWDGRGSCPTCGLSDEDLAAADAFVATREVELVRGVAVAGGQRWSERQKLVAFLGIFHPEMSAAEREAFADEAEGVSGEG